MKKEVKMATFIVCPQQFYYYVNMQYNQGYNAQYDNRRPNDGINIPLNNLLKCISFQPCQDINNPVLWTSLKIRIDLEASLEISQEISPSYRLQHQCSAAYDSSRKWKCNGEGDENQRLILGIVESKKCKLRAIQLPNNTHKNVIGFIHLNNLLTYCTPMRNQQKNTISFSVAANAEIPYTRIYSYFLRQNQPVVLGGKESFHNHSLSPRNNIGNPETEVNRADLSWHKQGIQKIIIQNGADVQDLARYKNILLSLRSDIFSDNHQVQIEGSKREMLQKRLVLLEQEIQGILKRKINFTSKGGEGSRFLDYTVILHQKQYQINELNRKIHSFENKIKVHQENQTKFNKEIQRLSEVLKTLNNPRCTPEQIRLICTSQIQVDSLRNKSLIIQERFNETNKLFGKHLESLRRKGIKSEHEVELGKCLKDNSEVLDFQLINGIFCWGQNKVIEKQCQDEKTQELLRCLSIELNRIYCKYPQVKGEADAKILEIIQRQLCHIIGADGLSNICEIIKFVPEVIRVENVYIFNAQKQRKLQFYLKVLLKALLDQMSRVKANSGIQICIDGGIIAMIHDQLGDCIDINAIIKCCSVYYKTVQVPYCIQKIVQRCIEVPTVIPIEKIIQKIIYETKYEQIQKIVHVPLKCIQYCDRIVEKIVQVEICKQIIVEVPRIVQRIVQKRVQCPKIVTVQIIVQKIVQVQKIVYVEKDICHIQKEICPVQIIRQKICTVTQTCQKIKVVDRQVKVIVERIVEKPVIIQVERCVEKLVPVIEYVYAKQICNHIEKVPVIIERCVQKIVPVIERVEIIKQVIKCVQKIVQVRVEIPCVKEIEVCVQKIIYVDRICEVQKIIEKPLTCYRQVIKEIQKIVQVPVFHERLVKCTEIHEKIVPQRCEVVKIVQVEKRRDIICEVTKLQEVMVPCYKYIIQEKPVKVCVQKIIEVPIYIERIKQVRVCVDKIIEKIVQVPKIVQVQKIIEKIVCVPRIVQKIVQVPKIVEVICERIIECEKIVEVCKQVRVPIIQEKIVQVEIVKYIQVPVYKEIQCIVQKIVSCVQQKEVIVPVDCFKEILVQVVRQCPKELCVEKIVTITMECQKLIECDKTIVIPVERPVCVDRIIEKLIVVEKVCEKPFPVEICRQVICQTTREIKCVEEICKKQQVIITLDRFIQIEKCIPYITRQPCEVQVCKDKIIPPIIIRQQIIKEVVNCQTVYVPQIHCIPEIYQFKEICQKLVQVPQYIQVLCREPIICYDLKIVDRVVTKCIPVVCIETVIECVNVTQQKIVQCQTIHERIKEVQVCRQIPVPFEEKLVVKCDTVNHFQTKYECIDRFQDKLVPVISCNERIIEIPHLIEKCMERVILLPQVHEVTKHIIEINQECSAGLCIDVDVEIHKQSYRNLYLALKKEVDILIIDLRNLKRTNPNLAVRIQAIQLYMRNLQKLNEFPKFVQVIKEKIVQKDKCIPLIIPAKDEGATKLQAFMLLLIQKLIQELKHASSQSHYTILDAQIKYLFLGKTNVQTDLKLRGKIKQYYESNQNSQIKIDLDNVLLNNALYDKFYMANMFENCQQECQKYKRLADERLSCMHQYKQINDILLARINGLKEKIIYLINNRSSCDVDFELNRCWKECDQINDIACCDIKKAKILDPCFNAFSGCDSSSYFSIYESRLRQKDAAIELSKRNLLSRMKQPHEQYERLLADKQRVIDSLSQTLTGVFQKSKRTQISISSDVNSQQQVSLGNVRHLGYYKHEAMVDNYMTRMSRDDGKSMTSINSLDHAQENQLKQKVVGNVAHYTNNNTNNNTGVLRAGRESTLPISARQSSESSQLESNTKVTAHVETNQQNQQRNVQGTTTTVQQNSFNYVINPHVDPTISEANRPRDYHNLPDILRPRFPQLIAQYNLQTQRNNALLIHERENRVMSTSRVNESIQMSTNNVRNDLTGIRSVEAPHQQATVISRNQLTGSRTSQISQNVYQYSRAVPEVLKPRAPYVYKPSQNQ